MDRSQTNRTHKGALISERFKIMSSNNGAP